MSAPVDRELEELRRHEYRRASHAVRAPEFTWPYAIVLVLLAFAPALPGAFSIAGFGVAVSAPVFLGLLAMHLVLVRLEARHPRAYVVGDAIETICHVSAYAFLILCSGRALAVPWFFLSMNAQVASYHPWRFVHRAAYVLMPIVLASTFALRGQRDDALLCLVLGAGVLMLLRVASTASEQRVQATRRIAELERQVERSRIARELHDGIGADLTAIALKARTASERADAKDREVFDALASRTRGTLAELRSVVWAVREPSVSFGALLEQLRMRAAELVPAPVVCTVEGNVPENEQASGEMSVLLLRVVQEAVNNAARHAHASAVRVALHHDAEGLTVEIADDGTFRPAGSSGATGNGLRNLRHRVEQAGGAFAIDVGASGTVVRATLPPVAPRMA